MDRRRFLVEMGAFAGAALVVPKAATIFDMGRAQRLVVPTISPDDIIVHPVLAPSMNKAVTVKGVRYVVAEDGKLTATWQAPPSRVDPDSLNDPEFQKWLAQELAPRVQRWHDGPQMIGLTPITPWSRDTRPGAGPDVDRPGAAGGRFEAAICS